MNRYLLFIFSALITSLTILTGCQDEDFGFTQEEIFRNAYERNFIKTYGEIDPNQSWDLSSFNLTHRETRAGSDYVAVDANGWYTVDVGYMKNTLIEGKTPSVVRPFGILMAEDELTVIPMYESGDRDVSWKLHMSMTCSDGTDPIDVVVWEKTAGTGNQDCVQVKAGTTKCSTCKGYGYVYKKNSSPCGYCNGQGYFPDASGNTTCPNQKNHVGTYEIQVDCDYKDCENGYDITTVCGSCNGAKETGWWFVRHGCTDCGGSYGTQLFGVGSKPGTGHGKCPKCDGKGKITKDCPLCDQGKCIKCPVCSGNKTSVVCTAAGCVNGYTDTGDWKYLKRDETCREIAKDDGTGYVEANQVKTLPFVINSESLKTATGRTNVSMQGSIVSFYLEITSGNTNAPTGSKISCLKGKMIDITPTAAKPSGIGNGCQYSLVGCEESTVNSDNDYNDVAFLLVSKTLPVYTYSQGSPVQDNVTKRYMVEDFGSNVDWDFNDIVIDVTEAVNKTLTTDEYGIPTGMNQSKIAGEWKTTASVIYLCGTLPIQVTFGQTNTVSLSLINDPTNKDQSIGELLDYANATHEYSGEGAPGIKLMDNSGIGTDIGSSDYDLLTNNRISIKGWKDPEERGNPAKAWSASFPAPGTVPYIIAVKNSTDWMKERTNVPASWFTGYKTPTDWHEGSTIPSNN